MNQDNRWYDLCRKNFSSREAALEGLDEWLKIMQITIERVLARKLKEGFIVKKPLEIQYVRLVEVLQTNMSGVTGVGVGAVFLEVKSIAELEKSK